MKQLTVGDILSLIKALKNEGMNIKEICSLPVYIGNDDELNGIHCAWDRGLIDADNPSEADRDIIEIINEDCCNIKIKSGKAILIF